MKIIYKMSNLHSIDDVKRNREGRPGEPQPGVHKAMIVGGHMVGGPKAQNAPPPQNSRFHGVARTLDGTIIQPPEADEPPRYQPTSDPIPEIYRNNDEVFNEYHGDFAMPPELSSNFWSWNLANESPEQISCGTICLMSYCPCFTGPICSETRKRDWCKFLRTITFWLSLLQLIMYIVSAAISKNVGWMVEPDNSALIKLGANDNLLLKEKYQIWRLLTYILLHGSIFHILFNGMVQLTFVLAMEASWGWWRFLIIYIISGIIGGLFSACRQYTTISVGASCSIFGVMGAYAALILCFYNRVGQMYRPQLMSSLIMLPVLFICVSFLPNIDWLGHLGGIVSGFGLGWLVFFNRAGDRKWRIIMIGGGASIVLASLIIPSIIVGVTKF